MKRRRAGGGAGTGTRDWRSLQRRSNAESDGFGSAWGAHRDRLTALIRGPDAGGPPAVESGPAIEGEPAGRGVQAAGGQGSLCLLGAGNGNDLDLPALAASFREIVLVDVDQAALERAYVRAAPEVRARLLCAPALDVSGGLLGRPLAWRPAAGPEALARELRAGFEALLAALPRREFDVVVSGFLLSQLNQNLAVALGTDRPGLREILDGVAVAHLELLGRLTRAGGRAVLATDVLSSDDVPLDEEASLDLLAHAAARDACYPGTNPAFLAAALRQEEPLRALFDRQRISAPWIWPALPTRRYLVYAMELRRTGG